MFTMPAEKDSVSIPERQYILYENYVTTTHNPDVVLTFSLGTPWGERCRLQVILSGLGQGKAPDVSLLHLAEKDVLLPIRSSTRLTGRERQLLLDYYTSIIPLALGPLAALAQQDPGFTVANNKLAHLAAEKWKGEKTRKAFRTTFSVKGAVLYVELWSKEEDQRRIFSIKDGM